MTWPSNKACGCRHGTLQDTQTSGTERPAPANDRPT